MGYGGILFHLGREEGKRWWWGGGKENGSGGIGIFFFLGEISGGAERKKWKRGKGKIGTEMAMVKKWGTHWGWGGYGE